MEVIFVLFDSGVVPNEHDCYKEEGEENGEPSAFKELDEGC